MGYSVSIVEQADKPGGKLNNWAKLFPDNLHASELLSKIQSGLHSSIQMNLTSKVMSMYRNGHHFNAKLTNGVEVVADAVLVSTGFEPFDARKKEEYGYGIYKNVITSVDLEEILRKGEKLKNSSGKIPKRVGMIHCVGSRDEKTGNSYCSKVCCITAVKQAIEIKESLPECEVFSFYMDLQMFGKHFQRNYKCAQVEQGVQYIRGRLSECFENPDGSVMLKVEDTLLGKPMKLNVDIAVLMVGIVPSSSVKQYSEMLGLKKDEDGFFKSADINYNSIGTDMKGVFVAGACTGPKTIENTINEARSAAVKINRYLVNM
jgi:heterodisulfide reductase subunit A